ncbi:hypothetical protein KJ660_00265, partial [Candidatus Micrarchaeota archaeon]|nr:hypothetical protein [Candidatus Micrarchaeota archaeon]
MVNEEVVLKTIKKMKASGIEDSIIKSALIDLGLKEEEINELIAKAESNPEEEEEPEEETPEPEEASAETNQT